MKSTYVYYNYRPHSDSEKRYEFDGWQSSYDYKNAPNIVTYETLEGKLVTNEITFYAHYKEEDRSQPSNNKYFTLKEKTIDVKKGSINEKVAGSFIQLADKYKTIFKGPITLPLNLDGKEIVGINDDAFKASEVNEVRFNPDGVNYYTYIGANAFEQCAHLERIEIPNTLLYIRERAFHSDEALAYTNLENNVALLLVDMAAFYGCKNLKISKLPDTLRYIDGSGFAFSGLSAEVLPRDIEWIGSWAFASSKVTINVIGAENSTIAITIKENAFNNTSPGTSVTIYPPIDNISNGAFIAFGKGFQTITIPADVADEQLAAWQLPIAENATISRTL
jgi:hypothetical protein